MNSCVKGKVGEREWRDVLREAGFLNSLRGQQYAGGVDSPDVICHDLPWCHFEVKRVERLNITDAMAQAERDCKHKIGVVAHRCNRSPWLVTMTAESLFKILRGDLPV